MEGWKETWKSNQVSYFTWVVEAGGPEGHPSGDGCGGDHVEGFVYLCAHPRPVSGTHVFLTQHCPSTTSTLHMAGHDLQMGHDC